MMLIGFGGMAGLLLRAVHSEAKRSWPANDDEGLSLGMGA
jgi:hypothetical protein